ncbi:MAG: hypothetical protein JWP89_1824 [Schlesneria sp.]|nr:hypothetical protein [Schlesneria sp.]
MSQEGAITVADVDRELAEWISRVFPALKVSFDLPTEAANGDGISLYLLGIEQAVAKQGRNPATQLSLRYLITAWDHEPQNAHRVLGELAFSAMEQQRLELEWMPLSTDLWTALQLRPRPAIVVRTQLARTRALSESPPVRTGLTTRETKLAPLTGVILGPNAIPIANASIEVATLKLNTRSDFDGRFRFPALPADLRPIFNVEFKGRKVTVTADRTVGSGKPLVIHLDESES